MRAAYGRVVIDIASVASILAFLGVTVIPPVSITHFVTPDPKVVQTRDIQVRRAEINVGGDKKSVKASNEDAASNELKVAEKQKTSSEGCAVDALPQMSIGLSEFFKEKIACMDGRLANAQ